MFAAGPPDDPGYAAMARAFPSIEDRTSGTVIIAGREPYWPSSNPSMPGTSDGFYGSSNASAKVVADTQATGRALIGWVIAIGIFYLAYKGLKR